MKRLKKHGQKRPRFQYRRRAAAHIPLRLLDHAADDDTYVSVLRALGKEIMTAADRVKRAGQKGREDYAEAVADQETELIENLLGTAYVLCQTPITAVVQAALAAREKAISDGLAFTAFGDRSHEVRALGDRFDARYSKIEVLWALANYFKHRDEWDDSVWDNPIGQPAITVPVLKAAGLLSSSTGNLRAGAEALGNPDYADVTVFETIIRSWADKVRAETRHAFGR